VSEPETVAVVRTRSAVDTRRLAEALARACRPGDVLLLVGGLGAGKTTFAQGLAAGLGVPERVTSPTFTLVRQYRTGRSEGIVQLLHADVYRLEDLAEIEDLALDELVEDGAVAAVEWGERAAPLLGADALVVELERDGSGAGAPGGAEGASGPGIPAVVSEDEGRTIALRAVGPRWQERAGEVAGLTRALPRT
jgi:tRNA threonylcarbamoyladenosine biosynthesis protein TsaE